MFGSRGFAAVLSPLVGLFASIGAQAATLPVYTDRGTENPFTYSFVATGGDITAYYLGTGAAYTNTLGLIANGVSVASGVLGNHSSAVGASYDFGSFVAGTALTFFINVQQTGQTFYSDTSLNKDGANHIYSTAFAASGKIPAGTYVGFEDLSADRSLAPRQGYNVDYNYTDEQFTVTNVSSVPLPASAPMFGAAVLALGLAGYGVKRKKAAATA